MSLDTDIKKKIFSLYNKGATKSEIARKLGISRTTVAKVLSSGPGAAKLSDDAGVAGNGFSSTSEKLNTDLREYEERFEALLHDIQDPVIGPIIRSMAEKHGFIYKDAEINELLLLMRKLKQMGLRLDHGTAERIFKICSQIVNIAKERGISQNASQIDEFLRAACEVVSQAMALGLGGEELSDVAGVFIMTAFLRIPVIDLIKGAELVMLTRKYNFDIVSFFKDKDAGEAMQTLISLEDRVKVLSETAEGLESEVRKKEEEKRESERQIELLKDEVRSLAEKIKLIDDIMSLRNARQAELKKYEESRQRTETLRENEEELISGISTAITEGLINKLPELRSSGDRILDLIERRTLEPLISDAARSFVRLANERPEVLKIFTHEDGDHPQTLASDRRIRKVVAIVAPREQNFYGNYNKL